MRIRSFVALCVFVAIAAALYWGVWKFVEHRSLDKALPLSQGKTYTLITSAILIETILMRVGAIRSLTMRTCSCRRPIQKKGVAKLN